MSEGPDLSEERRRAGDSRVGAEGRDLFRRMTIGDLGSAFQAASDADVVDDPLLDGHAVS
ncbi:MAG TPA: hypothetical protein VG455_15755 [Acidimicrobiales bacterium]|nr:hypothetical protein [Acidimicrobiales bacterium]